ncbi:MAG: hypothetical protein RR696_01365 [Clostridia bacterium]
MEQTVMKNNPLTFYVRTLLYMLLALSLRLIAFAPLVCLFVFPAGSTLRYLALLCPLLLIFVLLPLRYSMAEALVQKPGARRFSFDTALSLSHYGEKLTESLLHALNVIKWGIPLFLMLGYALYCFREIDLATLLGAISSIGANLTAFWCAIANFFITLFGSINVLKPAGGIGEGMLVIAAILGIGVAVWIYGAMRNSVNRYCWVLATQHERSPRVETRRAMRGRRFLQLLAGLLNLVLWMPFVWSVASVLKSVLSGVSMQLMMMLTQHKLPLIDMTAVLLPLMLAFAFLYLPLLPIRRFVTAAFAVRGSTHPAAPKQPKPKREPKQSTAVPTVAAPVTAVPLVQNVPTDSSNPAENHEEQEQNAAPFVSPDPVQSPVFQATPQVQDEAVPAAEVDTAEFEVGGETEPTAQPAQPANFTAAQ